MTRLAAFMLLALSWAAPSPAQVLTFTKEQLIEYTAKNPYDRFPDGRPKVPDALLQKARDLSSEEVWSVLNEHGYKQQYEGNFTVLHPGKKLVGRAVTVQFMPMRADVRDVAEEKANAGGPARNNNQRVIDSLQEGDVIVVDLMGKIEGGTFVGDNLAVAIQVATKTGGMVIDGAIRDLEGIFPLDMAAYFRGVHPSAINREQVMLTGVNVPIRIGNATVMPGDVVFGDREGVYFIPPHELQAVLTKADVTHIHDEWTKEKLMTGKYKSSEIYPLPSSPELKADYEAYLKKRLAETSPAAATNGK